VKKSYRIVSEDGVAPPSELEAMIEGFAKEREEGKPKLLPEGVRLQDFYAYMPQHQYLFVPTRELWPAGAVNGRLKPVDSGRKNKDGKTAYISPSAWLDRNRPVEQMTWSPGYPQLIHNALIDDGGWIERENVTCFNLYREPTIEPGDPNRATMWIDLVKKVYPHDWQHIVRWFAQRVQQPDVKINHALVLGGSPLIGKDTMIEPLKYAIGPWNFKEVNPGQMLGRFNGFVKCVVLRISEAHDLGDVNRFTFYEHMKTYIVTPPDTIRVDEKNLREHAVINVCGILFTTNHKTDGIYLPPDDRRHYIAWSPLKQDDFDQNYWGQIWSWYEAEGFRNVVAYLQTLDLSNFNPKAPPLKTPAFWDIVNASRPTEQAELEDVLDSIGRPDAITLERLISAASGTEIGEWLKDRKNRRATPHKLEACGYTPVRNTDANDGLWKISGKRQVVYAKSELPVPEQVKAARSV